MTYEDWKESQPRHIRDEDIWNAAIDAARMVVDDIATAHWKAQVDAYTQYEHHASHERYVAALQCREAVSNLRTVAQ